MGQNFDVLTNLNLHRMQLLNFVLQQLAGDHANPVEGMPWWDAAAHRFKIHDGSVARTVAWSGEGGGTGGGDANTLDGQDGVWYRDRANHTGTQLASTVSDFEAAVNALLGGYATQAYVGTQIAALVDTAPGTLDTLNELAAALGDDPNFATTITNALNQRARKFAALIGDGAATDIVVTHNFGTRDVEVAVYNSTTFAKVYPGIEHTTGNTVTAGFGAANAPALNAYRMVVLG